MTATFRYAQIPKVWGELRLVDLPPVEGTFPVDQVAGTRLSASGMTLLDTTAGEPRCPPTRNYRTAPRG
jgi:hypothetical protein